MKRWTLLDWFCVVYIVLDLLDGWWRHQLLQALMWLAAGAVLGVMWAIVKRRGRLARLLASRGTRKHGV